MIALVRRVLRAVTCTSCGSVFGQPHYPWCAYDLNPGTPGNPG